MKISKIAFYISIFVFLSSHGKAQVFINLYDSIGYKQGDWIEYRAIPTGILEGGRQTYNSDSSIVYSSDLDVYEGECFLIKQVGIYVNSLRVGLWKEYWPNGELRSKVNYSNGIPHGEYSLYFGDEKLAMKGFISYDSPSIREIYDENGILIKIDEVSAQQIIISIDRF